MYCLIYYILDYISYYIQLYPPQPSCLSGWTGLGSCRQRGPACTFTGKIKMAFIETSRLPMTDDHFL